MAHPIDFDVVRAALLDEMGDIELDVDRGRVDCTHCWSGIFGPSA